MLSLSTHKLFFLISLLVDQSQRAEHGRGSSKDLQDLQPLLSTIRYVMPAAVEFLTRGWAISPMLMWSVPRLDRDFGDADPGHGHGLYNR